MDIVFFKDTPVFFDLFFKSLLLNFDNYYPSVKL